MSSVGCVDLHVHVEQLSKTALGCTSATQCATEPGLPLASFPGSRSRNESLGMRLGYLLHGKLKLLSFHGHILLKTYQLSAVQQVALSPGAQYGAPWNKATGMTRFA